MLRFVAGALSLPAVAFASPSVGLQAMEAAQCTLCHSVPEVEPAPQVASCADCHAWVRATAASPAKRTRAMEVFPLWERYERSVATYLAVPDLQVAMARLEPEWVRDYLTDPYDLRPHMDETMPRFALAAADLDAIVAAFAVARYEPPPSPPVSEARVAQGRGLFESRGCLACHTAGALHLGDGLPQAPDLAHTRDRMSADMLAAWLVDPRSVSEHATMPPTGLSEGEALAVRDFLLLADLQATPASPRTAALPVVDRPVLWAEVEERVFGKICVHCHMDPAQTGGRGGPGNEGGFGWPATGLELQTYEGVAAASDRVIEALLRRRQEAHRDAIRPGEQPAALTRPAKPGMPLGLPPLPDDDIALVQAWIRQGTPR